jgi:TatD DNase family protein
MLLQNQTLLPSDQREISFSDINPSQIAQSRKQTEKLLHGHHWFVQVGVSIANFDLVYNLFKPIAKIKYIFGSHPELVNDEFDPNSYLSDYSRYIDLYDTFADPKVIGMGEIGLDYHYTQDSSHIQKQRLLLEGLLHIASDKKITPVFHVREAFEDFFAILDSFPSLHGRFLVHCFTGDTDQLKSILDRGGKVGYGGIITFGTNADTLRDTVKACPLDGFVLETDLPFLSPAPMRGKDCLPEYIEHVADKISQLKSLPQGHIWQSSLQNSRQLFANQFLS